MTFVSLNSRLESNEAEEGNLLALLPRCHMQRRAVKAPVHAPRKPVVGSRISGSRFSTTERDTKGKYGGFPSPYLRKPAMSLRCCLPQGLGIIHARVLHEIPCSPLCGSAAGCGRFSRACSLETCCRVQSPGVSLQKNRDLGA